MLNTYNLTIVNGLILPPEISIVLDLLGEMKSNMKWPKINKELEQFFPEYFALNLNCVLCFNPFR